MIEKIKTDYEYAAAALLEIYKFQEYEEQRFKQTIHQNNAGFNSVDSEFYSWVAEQIIHREKIKESHLKKIQNGIIKYHRQLPSNLAPVQIKIDYEDKPKYEITQNKKIFVAKFEYDSKKVGFIKSLKGKFYDPSAKEWMIETTKENFNRLKQSKIFKIHPDCKPTVEKEDEKYGKYASKLNNLEIKVEFKFPKGGGQFTECLNFIKSISGRAFNSSEKFWSIPLTPLNYEKLEKKEFKFSSNLTKWYSKNIYKEKMDIKEIPGIKGNLFPFQLDGVSFLEYCNGNALIADEMGTGKSLQSLAWCALHPEKRPVVVVCPATLKYNWENEIKKWLIKPGKIQILSGSPSEKNKLEQAEFYIINYEEIL